MKIALVNSEKRGETDQLIAMVARQLQSEDVALSGIVKMLDHTSEFANGCDMKVRVLPAGPVIKITQDLGKGSNACRLDPIALTTAVATVESQSMEGVDMFILNKFGPEEAAGRGFCAAIGAALERDIPVLVGVGAASRDAFDLFAGGLAKLLPPDQDVILQWSRSMMSKG